MVLDYYTNLAREFTFEEFRQGALGPVMVRREPVGVAGCIVPWNVPLFTIMLKLGPAMASGSTVVLKPAPETPLDAFLLADVLEEVGLPAGVINIVPAGREVGEHLVTHPDVDKIGFTGSSAAGRRIAALCGAQLKRCTLELGGKSAAIILDDADLATAIPALLPNAIMNNGQACIAQTRILASRSRYDDVVEALSSAMAEALVGGDPSIPRRWSARSSPSGSVNASRDTSPRAGKKGHASSWAEGVRASSRRVGSSSRRCSPTSTTR